ncbi:hypothetical protein ACSBR1_039239 [Camellia fascicularis]
MDSLYIPCVEHAKEWLSNSNHPIDSDPNVTYARAWLHGPSPSGRLGLAIPAVIHYLHHEYAKAPLFAVGTSIGANILIDDVCMGAIYIISLFMENMYT